MEIVFGFRIARVLMMVRNSTPNEDERKSSKRIDFWHSLRHTNFGFLCCIITNGHSYHFKFSDILKVKLNYKLLN